MESGPQKREPIASQWRSCKKKALLAVVLVVSATIAAVCKQEVMAWSAHHTPRSAVNLSTATSKEQLGYIVSNAYSGQQGSGVRALLSLQCWSASFSMPMRIVEPYIVNSSLKTRLKSKVDANTMRFSDYFDINHFNRLSHEEGYPTLDSWEQFVQNAPRNTIAVNIHDFKCKTRSTPVFQLVRKTERNTPCLSRRWLHNSQLEELDFCVVRVVRMSGCLSSADATRQMYDFVFAEWNPGNVTVVFRIWAADWDVLQNPKVRSEGVICKDKDGMKLRHRLRASPRLLGDAAYYTNMFLNSNNRIAVMIRSEQAIRGFRSDDRLDQLRLCLLETVEHAKNLSRQFSGSSSGSGIFLALDVGKYGSNSLNWVLHLDKYSLQNRSEEVIQEVKNVVPVLYNGKWTFEEWESSFDRVLNGVENPGYVGSLQRTIASQADCLVLMGGGDYQRLALVEYLENHSNQDASEQCRVHFVCFTDSYGEEFTNIVTVEESV